MTKLLFGHEKLVAAAAWARVFKSTNPFGWPFTETILSGRVLYPTDGCHLFPEQFQALMSMASKIGDSACYLAVVEGKEFLEGSAEERVYELSLDAFDSYSQLNLTLENAVFSTSGAWGILISHEMHAVVGGSANFIAGFDQIDATTETQWCKFREEWQADRHKQWLDSLAPHVAKNEHLKSGSG